MSTLTGLIKNGKKVLKELKKLLFRKHARILRIRVRSSTKKPTRPLNIWRHGFSLSHLSIRHKDSKISFTWSSNNSASRYTSLLGHSRQIQSWHRMLRGTIECWMTILILKVWKLLNHWPYLTYRLSIRTSLSCQLVCKYQDKSSSKYFVLGKLKKSRLNPALPHRVNMRW